MSDPDRDRKPRGADPVEPAPDSETAALEAATGEGMPEPGEEVAAPSREAAGAVPRPAGEPAAVPEQPAVRSPRLGAFAERPEETIEVPRDLLRARSRRD